MSKISIIVPTRNNQETVLGFAKELIDVCETKITQHDYEIIFVDNNSSDQTKSYLSRLCEVTQKAKCVYTVADYGFELSAKYGMTVADGDCVITMKPDRSHPIAAVPRLVELWEEGSKIIIGAKAKGGTNPIFNGLRNMFCGIIYSATGTKTMKQFTNFCLYDRSFVKTITSKAYKNMQIRSVINTLGLSYMVLPYIPSKAAPVSSFSQKYDSAMASMTTYPKGAIRLASMLGFYGGAASFIAGIVTLIMKLVMWESFTAAIPIVLLLGGVFLIISAIIAEYISSICQKFEAATFVKEDERINVVNNEKRTNK